MSPLTQPCPQRDVEYTQENKNTVVSLILFDDCPKVDCFVSPTSVHHPSYFFLVLDLNEGRWGAWPQIKNFFVMRHSCDTFCWKRPAFKHERSTQSRQGKKKRDIFNLILLQKLNIIFTMIKKVRICISVSSKSPVNICLSCRWWNESKQQ